MMYRWEEDMICFMQDASEYNNYNQELAEKIRPYLKKDARVCDAGCGLGYLSIALSEFAEQVTAVDININAINVLKRNCERKNISNINALCDDIEKAIPQQPYDDMVFCFFKNIKEILNIAKKQCNGTIFAIMRNYNNHRFSVGSYKCSSESYEYAVEYLESKGIPFVKQTLELELGQPFRCFADAKRFYKLYSRDDDKNVITDEFLSEKLQKTERTDFPFYLPHKRKLGCLWIETKNIPDKP